jgi:hypothetical protein
MLQSLSHRDNAPRVFARFGIDDVDNAPVQQAKTDPALLAIVKSVIYVREDGRLENPGSVREINAMFCDIDSVLPRIPFVLHRALYQMQRKSKLFTFRLLLNGVVVEVAGRHNGVIVAQPHKEKASPRGGG